MKQTSLRGVATALVISASMLAPVSAQAANTKMWDHLSTGLALGLGGVAAATTLEKSDKTGAKQFAFTLGATFLATEALKSVVHEPRPDGSGHDGFPSGHTAMAFAAATYFSIRYGQQYRQYVPLVYGAAALTGISRIKARKHYARDVFAGALLGWGVAKLLTTPENVDMRITPTATGASLTYTTHF